MTNDQPNQAKPPRWWHSINMSSKCFRIIYTDCHNSSPCSKSSVLFSDTFLCPSINSDRARSTEKLILLCDSIHVAEKLSRMLPQLSRPDPTMSGTNGGIIIGQDFIPLTHHDIPLQSEHYAVLRTVKDSSEWTLSRYSLVWLGLRRGGQTVVFECVA